MTVPLHVGRTCKWSLSHGLVNNYVGGFFYQCADRKGVSPESSPSVQSPGIVETLFFPYIETSNKHKPRPR